MLPLRSAWLSVWFFCVSGAFIGLRADALSNAEIDRLIAGFAPPPESPHWWDGLHWFEELTVSPGLGYNNNPLYLSKSGTDGYFSRISGDWLVMVSPESMRWYASLSLEGSQDNYSSFDKTMPDQGEASVLLGFSWQSWRDWKASINGRYGYNDQTFGVVINDLSHASYGLATTDYYCRPELEWSGWGNWALGGGVEFSGLRYVNPSDDYKQNGAVVRLSRKVDHDRCYLEISRQERAYDYRTNRQGLGGFSVYGSRANWALTEVRLGGSWTLDAENNLKVRGKVGWRRTDDRYQGYDDNTRWGASTGLVWNAPHGWSFSMDAGLSWVNYDLRAISLTNKTARHYLSTRIEAKLGKQLSPAWEANLTGSGEWLDANWTGQDYVVQQTIIGLTWSPKFGR